jgi:hypothetical protein
MMTSESKNNMSSQSALGPPLALVPAPALESESMTAPLTVAASLASTVAPKAAPQSDPAVPAITNELGAKVCSDKNDEASTCTTYTLKLPITSVVSLPKVNSSDCCLADPPSAASVSASAASVPATSDVIREVQTHTFPMIIGTSTLPPL